MLRRWLGAFALPAVLPVAAPAQPPAPTTFLQPGIDHRRLSPDAVRDVAPALEQYTQQRLYGEVWQRPGLSRRDRSLVAVAALIARGEAPALGYYADQAIENGVTPAELSETITQLAFYTGWGNAMAAVGPVREVFRARGVGRDRLPPAFGPLEPIDEAADKVRADRVADANASVSPGVVDYTNGVLFRELWRRPYLAQRDRSLVTIAALVATGKADQLAYHVERGMGAGLTRGQIGEALTQLAFYAGWPQVFDALPVVKAAFAKGGAAKQR